MDNANKITSAKTLGIIFEKSCNGLAYHKIITDKKGKPVDYYFIEVNRSFEKFTGLIRKNIIGKRVTEVIPGIETDKAGWIEKYGEVALSGKELKFEQYSEALGKWFDIYAYSPEKDYFITEFSDITAEKNRQLTETALINEKKKFNDLFETIPAYLILLNGDYRIPYANRFFRERFGDPLGRRCYEYLFGRTEPCEVCDTYKVLETRAPLEWEWTGPDKRFYYIYDFPFKDTDGSDLILEMGIDITELKHIQEELQKANENLEERVALRTRELIEKGEKIRKLSLAVEQNPASIVITDKYGKIEYVNPIFTQTTGYTLEEAVGKSPNVLKSGLMPSEVYRELWETILSGKIWKGVLCNRKKNGDLYWESVLISPIQNENGTITHFVGVKENITDKKRMEDELIKKNNDLTKINELLEDFVYIAAHDLRSPIASIKATSEFIEHVPDADAKMSLFKNLLPIVNRLERTIDGLVETINVQKNDKIIFKKLMLKDIYNEVINNLTAEIKKHNAIVNFDDSAGYLVYVEPYLLSIFTNLIHNALKYSTEERKPVINISTSIHNDYFLISFKDNGVGMNLDVIGKDLFKPFKRFSKKAEGKGMGLYIIKNIIEKNGGYIKVESKVNEGTTFHCYLKEYTVTD